MSYIIVELVLQICTEDSRMTLYLWESSLLVVRERIEIKSDNSMS